MLFIFIAVFLFLSLKNKTTADMLFDELIAALNNQFGFTYDLDPTSKFVFSRATPNYNVYAANKSSNGGHGLLLERNGKTLEIKFDSVDIYPSVLPSIPADSTPTPSPKAEEGKTLLEKTVDDLTSQVNDLGENIEDISEKIAEVEQGISEISSKGKLIPFERGQKVIFEDIVYGLDLDYSLNEGGITQEIKLKNRNNIYNIYTFTLYYPGLIFKDVGNGVWYFQDRDNNNFFRIPKAWATDAKGDFTNDVGISVKAKILATEVKIHVPRDWLEAQQRAFPIIIHTAYEIVPNLRDGNSKPLSADASPTPIDISPTESASVSPTLEILEPSEDSPIP